MSHKEFVAYLKWVLEKHPEFKYEINNLFHLCQDEIEQGGSPEHERQLCISEVEDLIKSVNS